MPTNEWASRIARVVVVGAGLGLVALWTVLALAPRGAEGGLAGTAGAGFWLVWMIFTGLAFAAVGGALRRLPAVTLMAAFVSLVPVGLYFLVVPGVMRCIGLLDFVLVAAAGVGWWQVRAE